MFDTHCHLNFKTFHNQEELVVDEAKKAGVDFIVVPGTDIETSKKAVELAKQFPQIYAAIGIHPHHIYEIIESSKNKVESLKKEKIEVYSKPLKGLINQPKVVAIGEVGLDRYLYQKTKYKNYQITNDFLELQKHFLIKQIKLASNYQKTLIIHNRQAKNDLLALLKNLQPFISKINLVFHCCEPDEDLLNFAIKNKVYIGIDGDITYDRKKQTFVKKIPLELLVLETDAPFLLPEPLRQQKLYPNQPKNLPLIVQFIANLLNVSKEKLIKITTENGRRLFRV